MKESARAKIAAASFSTDYNCAQSSFKALADYSSLSDLQAEGIAAGFGGGMGKHQEICGAVSGACMGLSIAIHEMYEDHQEGKDAAYEAVKQLMNRFKAEKTHVRCLELAGYDFSIEAEREKFLEEGLRESVCENAVTFAVELAEALIEDHKKMSGKV